LRRNVEKIVDPIRASLREEAHALGIRQDGFAYVTWLKLQRDHGLTGEQAAEQMRRWDDEITAEKRGRWWRRKK